MKQFGALIHWARLSWYHWPVTMKSVPFLLTWGLFTAHILHLLIMKDNDLYPQFVVCICFTEKDGLRVVITDLIKFSQKIWVNIFPRFCLTRSALCCSEQKEIPTLIPCCFHSCYAAVCTSPNQGCLTTKALQFVANDIWMSSEWQERLQGGKVV